MTNKIDPKFSQWACHLAGQLRETMQNRLLQMEGLQQELDALEGRTCTGKEHWRDENTPGRSAKLYIIHSVDEACPIHGEPKPGKRVRTYIGCKKEAIEDAKAAIERERRRKALNRELYNAQDTFRSAAYSLQRIFYGIGYSTPPTGEIGEVVSRK
jgi:hypothetical protein